MKLVRTIGYCVSLSIFGTPIETRSDVLSYEPFAIGLSGYAVGDIHLQGPAVPGYTFS